MHQLDFGGYRFYYVHTLDEFRSRFFGNNFRSNLYDSKSRQEKYETVFVKIWTVYSFGYWFLISAEGTCFWKWINESFLVILIIIGYYIY